MDPINIAEFQRLKQNNQFLEKELETFKADRVGLLKQLDRMENENNALKNDNNMDADRHKSSARQNKEV